MPATYQQIQITASTAESIAYDLFDIKGTATKLDGEIDFNFKISTPSKNYILKVSRPDIDEQALHFQDELLKHLAYKNIGFQYPKRCEDKKGNTIATFIDAYGSVRKVRMIEWIEGKLYDAVNPKTPSLRYSLGQCCGQVTTALLDFEHTLAQRTFDWDLNNALWTEKHLGLFTERQKQLVEKFIERFKAIQPQYQQLRKSTIHNDANENNIIVSDDPANPTVEALIDYGDAVCSQIINDLSVALAYGVMNTIQPLEAAKNIVAGYHSSFPLLDEELQVLYTTTAMRLVISVTKSAINKQKEPDNKYLLISEKPAWHLLEIWATIPENLAYYTFRNACGLEPCPQFQDFMKYAKHNQWLISTLLPTTKNARITSLDLSVGSTFTGNFSDYLGSEKLNERIANIVTPAIHRFSTNQEDTFENTILVGGYGEIRPFYATDAFKIATDSGYEHRTIHIGVDFWVSPHTAIHAVEDGTIFGIFDNANPKDYGPTIILKHDVNDLVFYTLHGHLTRESLQDKSLGKAIRKGDKIGEIGVFSENGNWAPHLHFQIILDMLGHQHDFIGVSSPSQWEVFASICPDPNILFKEDILTKKQAKSTTEQLTFRKQHLGKSLSLSYKQPLTIVRGQMQYLIDYQGQKYLDTVNNVAHVGHEHPAVVRAGQAQMTLLNTNTRYLNDEILDFAAALLKTFPPELSVVHFVNSGSEANELALRMARTYTNQKDIIALEVGYHGNTQGCIDISSYKFDGKGGKGRPHHTHIVPLPDSFRGIYRGENTGLLYAKHVQQAIEYIQAEGRNVAAFIAESIVSCGGQIDLPTGYLPMAYEAIRKAGGVCIADEVQVGFGRVGKTFWGFELHGVVPDIVTMGKPIGNGHPLAAVVCTQAVAEAFANGMEYFNTFGGNPVSCAIGKKVLKVIQAEQLQTNAYQVGEYLKKHFHALQSDFPIIGDVRGEGLFLGIELVDKNKNPLTDKTSYLANRMKDHRILMSIDGPQNNVLKIKPPMCFSLKNADELLTVMEKVLKEDMMRIEF